MGLWRYWGEKMVEFGPRQFYQRVGWCDYLPLYPFFLGGIEFSWQFLNQFSPVSKEILHKIPASLADVATVYLLYLLGKRRSKKLAFLAAIAYAFNPAIFGNSSLWGQVDSLGAFLVLGATFFLLEDKPVLAGLFSGLSLVMKPLYLVILPFFLFLMRKRLRKFIAALLAAMTVVVLPFSLFDPLGFLWERYRLALSQYPYTSVNAFNFWAIGNRWWQSDQTQFWGLTYQRWGLILFGLVYALVFFYLWQTRKRRRLDYPLLLSLSTIFAALFVFPTRVHERHLFNVFPFLVALTVFEMKAWLPFFLFSLTSILNLYFSYFWLIEKGKFLFGWGIINSLAVINLLLAVILVITVFKQLKPSWQRLKRLFKKHRVLIFILAFSLLARLWHLNYPPSFYFDEVYHAFTAREIVRGNKAAWEWWNEPPEGFAYEWTHPPLAKLGMVAGIILLGENSFSWRFPGAILGVGCLLLIYLIAKKLFNWQVAILAIFLASLDGLPLVMSRIGMNDTYFLFFALLTLWLFLEKRYLFSGLAFGLALASKWTAFYLLPVLGLWELFELIKQRKNQRFDYLKKRVYLFFFAFLVLPFAVYLLTHFFFFTSGHDFSTWWELQKQMWWYHTRLTATHNYGSTWWSWVLMQRPVWFFVNYKETTIANIYATGNPLIFWGGLLVLPWVIYQALKRKERELILIIFAYFVFFLPWAFSPRVMFLYHYLPSLIFLCLFLGWTLNHLAKKRRSLVLSYLVLVIGLFFFFYPHWAGFHVPQWLDKLYYWFFSWK